MIVAQWKPAATAVACCVALLSACGGSSDPAKPAATTTLAAPAKPVATLATALYPTCGVKRFQKPNAQPLEGPGGGRYWRIIYQIPITAPRIKGAPTQMTIVEQSPKLPFQRLEGGRDIVVAGQNVSLRPARPKTPSNVAQWNTSKAKYIVLADGSIDQLRRVIACFP